MVPRNRLWIGCAAKAGKVDPGTAAFDRMGGVATKHETPNVSRHDTMSRLFTLFT
jgi:hypothetical protein